MCNIFKYIGLIFPYKINGHNNKIYVYIKNKRIKLKGKIKDLDITINGDNNTIELYYPFKFKHNCLIEINGNNSSFKMLPTNTVMNGAQFFLENDSNIFIDVNASLIMPNLYVCVNNNKLNNPHSLKIGKNVQIGKDCIIRTSDGHSIFNIGEEKPYNEPQDITIGDNVWIGSNVTILKGSIIPKNTVIGACSLINKKFTQEHTIIAGNPAKIIKRDIEWNSTTYGNYFRLIETKQQISNKNRSIVIQKLIHKFDTILLQSFLQVWRYF